MQIQLNERDKIAIWFNQGLSIREIGRRLGRDHSVISRELKRNRCGDGYQAIHAHKVVARRKVRSRRRHPLKNPQVYAYVIDKLRCNWSPEEICGRLEKVNGESIICWETIYNFVHQPKNISKGYWEYLPLKRKRRIKRHGRKAQRVRIPARVSIHSRDKRIEKRKQFGHWEGDTVIGRHEKSKAIHTAVERKTRFLAAKVINSKSAVDTVIAQKEIFNDLPAETVTVDNGLEFARHQELNQLGIKTYFADPYSSWQRGTNENTNGLLRRYLPKKTNFDNLDQKELDDIVTELNNRPRKVLQFSTPFEAFQKELSIRGGAFPIRM